MTIPVNKITPATNATKFYSQLAGIKRACEIWRNSLAGGTVILDRVLEPAKQLRFHRDLWTTYLTVANRTYIATDLGQDVLADFVAIRNAINDLLLWVDGVVVKNPDGSISERQFLDGVLTYTATITPAQAAPAIASLDVILARLVEV
jgi:hypothetical protein